MSYDVIIVGGGPAGLSAALVLGRARKRVLLVDCGEPRNAASERMYGFVTWDGAPSVEFRNIARKQLEAYPTVAIREARASHIEGRVDDFEVLFEGGGANSARRVLLCLGIVDEMLDLPGYRQLWGKAVFGCPYCHGWEMRDRALGYLATTSASTSVGRRSRRLDSCSCHQRIANGTSAMKQSPLSEPTPRAPASSTPSPPSTSKRMARRASREHA